MVNATETSVVHFKSHTAIFWENKHCLTYTVFNQKLIYLGRKVVLSDIGEYSQIFQCVQIFQSSSLDDESISKMRLKYPNFKTTNIRK